MSGNIPGTPDMAEDQLPPNNSARIQKVENYEQEWKTTLHVVELIARTAMTRPEAQQRL